MGQGDGPGGPIEPGLEARFARESEKRDSVVVVRADGSTGGWSVRALPQGAPQDLVQLVVEATLELPRGFWGLLAEGVDVLSLRDRDRRHAEPDLSPDDVAGLAQAEAVASALRRGATDGVGLARLVSAACARRRVDVPTSLTVDRAEELASRVADVQRRWASLGIGEGLTLAFP